MNRTKLAIAAGLAVLALAGCGGTAKTPAPSLSYQGPVRADGCQISCDGQTAYTPPPSPTPTAGPLLTVTATLGCYDPTSGIFTQPPCAPYTQQSEYQILVINSNSYPVNISTVQVGFYDASGNELAAENIYLGIIQIAANQSYSEYETPDQPDAVSVQELSWSP